MYTLYKRIVLHALCNKCACHVSTLHVVCVHVLYAYKNNVRHTPTYIRYIVYLRREFITTDCKHTYTGINGVKLLYLIRNLQYYYGKVYPCARPWCTCITCVLNLPALYAYVVEQYILTRCTFYAIRVHVVTYWSYTFPNILVYTTP